MTKSPSIALLGWGSLLWDPRPEFDEQHEAWQPDGPVLPIEFSRISETRQQALTLVLDNANGATCKVAYAPSRRRNLNDAICDLRCREGTTWRNIGFYFADGSASQAHDASILGIISEWAKNMKFDAVVWTALESNFTKIKGASFSVAKAVEHVSSLGSEGKTAAFEYVTRSPEFVVTPLKTALMREPWFSM